MAVSFCLGVLVLLTLDMVETELDWGAAVHCISDGKVDIAIIIGCIIWCMIVVVNISVIKVMMPRLLQRQYIMDSWKVVAL